MLDVRCCSRTPGPPGFRRGDHAGQTCPKPPCPSKVVKSHLLDIPSNTSTKRLVVLAAGARCLGQALAELDQEVLGSPLVLFYALCSSSQLVATLPGACTYATFNPAFHVSEGFVAASELEAGKGHSGVREKGMS